jgi:hypothetical protein
MSDGHGEQQRLLLVEPHELAFTNVRLHKVGARRRAPRRARCCISSTRQPGRLDELRCPPWCHDCGSAAAWVTRTRHHSSSTAACRLVKTARPPRRMPCPTRPCQTYAQRVRLTNTALAPLEGEVRPGSSDRYSVAPASFRLQPGESLEALVTLKVLRFGARVRAVEQGQRDWFTVKISNFPGQDQRFYATFFLDAAEAADGGSSGGGRDTSPALARSASVLNATRSGSGGGGGGGGEAPSATSPSARPTLRRSSSHPLEPSSPPPARLRRASLQSGAMEFALAAGGGCSSGGILSSGGGSPGGARIRKSVSFAGDSAGDAGAEACAAAAAQQIDSGGAGAAGPAQAENPFFQWSDTFLARRQQLARARAAVASIGLHPAAAASAPGASGAVGGAAEDCAAGVPEEPQPVSTDSASKAVHAEEAASATAGGALQSLQERLQADRAEIEQRLRAVAAASALAASVAQDLAADAPATTAVAADQTPEWQPREEAEQQAREPEGRREEQQLGSVQQQQEHQQRQQRQQRPPPMARQQGELSVGADSWAADLPPRGTSAQATGGSPPPSGVAACEEVERAVVAALEAEQTRQEVGVAC